MSSPASKPTTPKKMPNLSDLEANKDTNSDDSFNDSYQDFDVTYRSNKDVAAAPFMLAMKEAVE